MELSFNPSLPSLPFVDYSFSRTFVINTHGELNPKDSFIEKSPCGVIFLTDIGKTFSTFTTIDDRLFHPVIDRVIEKTHIRTGHPKTGGEILSILCELREVPEHNWVGDKQARIRGIPKECKFSGHIPGSLIPNNILFTGGGTALVNEGVFMLLDDGTQFDVSAHFGLRKIPLQQPYKGQPSRSDPDNFNVKKDALYRLIRKNDKLSSLPKGSSDAGIQKRKTYAYAKHLKDFMFSIEPKVPVGKPYQFVGKHVNDDITLRDILGYASKNIFLQPTDLVIVSSCRVSDDHELVDDLKALVAMNSRDAIGIGGNNARKHKNKKHLKSKYVKSRKISRRRRISSRKTRRIIKRKYKK
jgi:hypothetical protein